MCMSFFCRCPRIYEIQLQVWVVGGKEIEVSVIGIILFDHSPNVLTYCLSQDPFRDMFASLSPHTL